jgi:hypothetical protein
VGATTNRGAQRVARDAANAKAAQATLHNCSAAVVVRMFVSVRKIRQKRCVCPGCEALGLAVSIIRVGGGESKK